MNLTFFKLSPSFILCWHISKLAKFLLRPRWGIQNWRERTQTGAWLHRLLGEESWRRMLLVGWPTSPLPTAQTHVYSRSLSQNIPQSKSPGYLPLGRLRTRACSQDSWGPIPLFQQWLHRCQGCWKWELHPPPWSPAFRHHPWLGDDVWRGVRTSYWTVSGRKHWEEKPLPLPVCSLSASHLCLESWALGFLLLPCPLLAALLPRPDGLLVLWTCQPKCALSFTDYLGLSNFMTETENELIQKQKTNKLYLSTWYGSWLCEYISVSHTCS